jgi:protoporphyrinogen IX oxidase
MQHVITYDLARGLHIIAVIAWIAGLLMLPRFYAGITASQQGAAPEKALLDASRSVRTIILLPALVLSWAFGLFLFAAYFVPDREARLADLIAAAPLWFWFKILLVVILSGYHGFLVAQGRRLASGERRHSERFWRIMSIAPFIIAIGTVLLATIEP